MWRPEALRRGLQIGKSQPQSKVGNFECFSWLNGLFFGDKHLFFFLERGIQDLSNDTNIAS